MTNQKSQNICAEEIPAEWFKEIPDVFPTIFSGCQKDVEMFCMSEFRVGNNTRQFAHDYNTDKYYTKLVDYKDPSTWICETLYPEV